MKKSFFIDIERCTGCEACIDACSGHQADFYSNAMSCIQLWKDKPRTLFIPLVCEQCREHPCVEVCPVEAIRYDHELSIFRVDQELCTTCGACEEACTYQGIFVTEDTAWKCDLCGGEPECVEVCYPRALQFIEVNADSVLADLKAKTRKLEKIRSASHD